VIGTSRIDWFGVDTRKKIAARGKSFCHVISKKHIGQLRAAMTFGNQKWSGEIPPLSIRAIISGRVNWLERPGVWV